MATSTINRKLSGNVKASKATKASKQKITLADKLKRQAATLTRLGGKRKLAKAPDDYTSDSAQLDRTFVLSFVDTYVGRRIGDALDANKHNVTPKALALALGNKNAKRLILDAITVHDDATKARHALQGVKPETIKAHNASVASAIEAINNGAHIKLAESIGRLATSGNTDYSVTRIASEVGVPDTLIGYVIGIVSPSLTRSQRVNADIVTH